MTKRQAEKIVGTAVAALTETPQHGEVRKGATPEEIKANQPDRKKIEAEMDRVKGIEAMGHIEAQQMIRKDRDHALSQVELWKRVATFKQEAEAVSFIKGFRDECETEAEKGGEIADSAGRIARNVSVMKRVARAIFGWNTKDEKTQKPVRTFHEEPYSSDVADNREQVLKILEGPGSWSVKAGLLPKLEGRGRPEGDDEESTTPYQRTINTANAVDPAKGDAKVMADVLKVPTKMDGEDIPEDQRVEMALAGLKQVIKSLPEGQIGHAAEAIIGKCLISSDRKLQEFGLAARDLYNRIITGDKDAPVVVRRTAGAQAGDTE